LDWCVFAGAGAEGGELHSTLHSPLVVRERLSSGSG
jgi:hypothetical protein